MACVIDAIEYVVLWCRSCAACVVAVGRSLCPCVINGHRCHAVRCGVRNIEWSIGNSDIETANPIMAYGYGIPPKRPVRAYGAYCVLTKNYTG